MRPTAQAASVESPAKQVTGFIDKFDPKIGKRIREVRAALGLITAYGAKRLEPTRTAWKLTLADGKQLVISR